MTVTVDALSTIMRVQGVGELPTALRPAAVWTDPDADREAAAAAWTELREVCWVDRRGQLDANALDALYLLAHPGVEYTAILAQQGRQDAVVVAARGTDAVIAYREGQAITVSTVQHQPLPETLLRQIPNARPAPINAINIRLEDLATIRHDVGSFGDGQAAIRDAGAIAILARRRLISQGELYVAIRDPYGRHRISPPIRYQDYRIGRVVVVTGQDYLSVAPASKVLLRDRLRSAHRDMA